MLEKKTTENNLEKPKKPAKIPEGDGYPVIKPSGTNSWKKIGLSLYSLILFLVMLYFISKGRVNSENDYLNYVDHTYFLQNGINPYTMTTSSGKNYYYSKYPAFYFYFMTLLGLMGIHSIEGIKLVYIAFTVVNVFLTYKLYYVLKYGNLKKGDKIGSFDYFFISLFLFYPHVVFFMYHGDNDGVSVCFEILSIYYLIKNRPNLSAALLGLGIMYKIFPIFLLIPVTVYFYNKKEYRRLVVYWVIIGAVFLLLSLPFLIISPNDYLNDIFIQTKRSPDGWGYTHQFPGFFNDPVITILWFKIAWFFIVSVAAILLFIVLFVHKFKRPDYRALIVMSFYSLLLPSITSFQDHITVYIRYFPFLFIIIYDQIILSDKVKKVFNLVMLHVNFLISLMIWRAGTSLPYSIRFIYSLIFLVATVFIFKNGQNRLLNILFYIFFITIPLMAMVFYPYEKITEYRTIGRMLFILRMILYGLIIKICLVFSNEVLGKRYSI